jgi:DNA-binding NarL/FixJ family response regulator
MMQDDFQGQQNNIPGGLAVCILSSAPALQAGLSSLLRDLGMVEAVYTASSLDEFEFYRAITDILLIYPGEETSADLEQILDDSTLSGVVILIADKNERSVLPAIPGLPCGVLPLTATLEQVEATLSAIAAGLSVGMPGMVSFLDEHDLPGQEDPLIDPLTDREMEVLQMLARGKANKQIALDLGISEHTVKFHVSSVYTKLGASNRTEAVRLGVRRGLITL